MVAASLPLSQRLEAASDQTEDLALFCPPYELILPSAVLTLCRQFALGKMIFERNRQPHKTNPDEATTLTQSQRGPRDQRASRGMDSKSLGIDFVYGYLRFLCGLTRD